MNGRELNGTLVEDIPPEPVENGTIRLTRHVLPSRLKVVKLRDGVKLKGATDLSDDVTIAGSKLKRASDSKTDFVGALLSGESLRGKPVLLRLDKITSVSAENSQKANTEKKSILWVDAKSGVLLKLPRFVVNDDVQLYRVYGTAGTPKPGLKQSFKTGGRPLCSGDNLAIAIPGAWNYRTGSRESPVDPTLVTFACLDAAIAKCIEPVGYRPWALHPAMPTDGSGGNLASVSLEPYHEACVRAMRADYCGNSFSLTRNGTLINIYDTIGIQDRLSDLNITDRKIEIRILESPINKLINKKSLNDKSSKKDKSAIGITNIKAYQFEAKWSPEGALCIDETRQETIPVSSDLRFASFRSFTTSGEEIRIPMTRTVNVTTYIQEHCGRPLEIGQTGLCQMSSAHPAPGTIFTEFETKN